MTEILIPAKITFVGGKMDGKTNDSVLYLDINRSYTIHANGQVYYLILSPDSNQVTKATAYYRGEAWKLCKFNNKEDYEKWIDSLWIDSRRNLSI